MRAINFCSINLNLRLKHEPRAQHIYDTGTISATTEAYSDYLQSEELFRRHIHS